MKSAFTITELLVVTAIIGVLAAVLFPVLSEQPRSIAACLSNENQLISGAILYAADYDDHVLPWLSCGPSLSCSGVRFDVDRIWTSRLKPYVSSPLDPETGDPYFPPSAPYRCPDWNLSRLTAGADANDCDGPGTIEGLTSFVLGRHMRSELFSTYGLVFGMCSFQEAQSGLATCMRNGGYTPDYTSYGRGGTSANDAMFTFAGDELYPPSTGLYLGRTLAQIARPSETVMLGDGGTWKRVPGYYTTVFGCEGDHMHWQHVWGGNVAFADGHANWIGGNPEGITQVGTDGFWIEKYFTFYE